MYGEAGKSYYGAVKADAGLTLCSPHFKNTFYLSGEKTKKRLHLFLSLLFYAEKYSCIRCAPAVFLFRQVG